jgi:hypothetical protein
MKVALACRFRNITEVGWKGTLNHRVKRRKNLLRFLVLTASSMKMTVFWEAVYGPDDRDKRTYETTVNFYQTSECNIPNNSHL